MSLGSVLLVAGCEGASDGEADAAAADVVSTPDIPVDTEAPSDVPSVVPDSVPDAEDATDALATDALDETSDTAANVDVITIDPCDVPGVPSEAVRCYDPPMHKVLVLGNELIAIRYASETERHVVLIRNDGAIIDELDEPLEDFWDIVPCGSSICALSYGWDDTEIRLSSQGVNVQGGQLVSEAASMPLILPRNSGARIFSHAGQPTVMVGNSTGPWQRCVLSAVPTCEDIPVPVECAPGEHRFLTSVVDGPTTTIIAGQCEYPNVAADGVGRPFVFEWERGTGVSWSTQPEAWVGLSSLQLYPDAEGYSVVALQLPQGGSDDTGAPIGLSLAHIGTDGVPGDVWNSPLTNGFHFFATAAVRGGDMLVVWTGANGESASEVRLTFASAGSIPTTTSIAPIGYEPGGLAAFGDGYVLNLSGRLVRLDAAGAPVAWPTAP